MGAIIWYPVSTPPVGWLVCNGQSTVGYPALSAVVGANVPDLRGEFVRGLDLGRGVDSGRILGSIQGDAIRNITGSFYALDKVNQYAEAFYNSGAVAVNGWGGDGVYWYSKILFDSSRIVPTADENRPRNIALLPCIKY